MNPEAFPQPMQVEAVDGEVVILGPDGLNGSMTPDAAEASGRRLLAAAAEARGHRAREGAAAAANEDGVEQHKA